MQQKELRKRSSRCLNAASRRRGRSPAQHATTMLFPHFVGDARSREPHQLGE